MFTSRLNVTFNTGGTVTIGCIVGASPTAFTLHGGNLMDVVVVDNQGRTATGIQQLTLNNAPSLYTTLWLFLCFSTYWLL